MDAFLEAAGVAALGVVAVLGLVLLVVWLLWRKFKRWIGDLAMATQPDTIELNSVDELDWEEPETVERWTEQVLAAGYQPAGLYEVEELGGLPVAGFVEPRQGLLVSIAEQGEHLFIDFIAEDLAGKTVNYSNAPDTGMQSPPWKTNVKLSKAEPSAIHAEFMQVLPPSRRPVTVTDFKQRFEEAWEREMAWRKERGGSAEEVDAVAARMRSEGG